MQVSEDKRKTGTDKAFPQKVKSLMSKKESLLASRRGIVDNFHEQEKPSFSPEELIANRKRGISFSCIGKKLGIDNTKGEVLNVFTVMKECDGTLPDVQEVQTPSLRNYPTPLWYLFDSELDIIARESVPDIKKILATSVQEKVASRLGERGCDMLSTFIEVNEIIKEELIIAMNNGSSESHLGMLAGWTNNLPRKVLNASSETYTSIAKAALHHTADNVTNKGSGRCQCGGVRALKFTWREGNDSVPSFFWGCSRYRVTERFQHDRGIPYRNITLKSLLDTPQHMVKLPDSDLDHLLKLVIDDEKNQSERPDTEGINERLLKVYGGIPDENQPVSEYIHSFVDRLTSLVKKRQEKSHVYLEECVPHDDTTADL